MELAAWRQIAEDPLGFAMALKACDRAADDLAAALHEQLQLDRPPASIRTICDFDTWKNAGAPTDPTVWSFHALYESSIFLCPKFRHRCVRSSDTHTHTHTHTHALLYRMICKYLISGTLDYCPPVLGQPI